MPLSIYRTKPYDCFHSDIISDRFLSIFILFCVHFLILVYQEERELYKSLTESLKLKLKEAELALKNQVCRCKMEIAVLNCNFCTDVVRGQLKLVFSVREVKSLISVFHIPECTTEASIHSPACICRCGNQENDTKERR